MKKVYLVCHYETLGTSVIASFDDENDARELYADLALEEMYETFMYLLNKVDTKDYCGYVEDYPRSDVEIALEEAKYVDDYFIIAIPHF